MVTTGIGRSTIDVIDKSLTTANTTIGLCAVLGITERGQHNTPVLVRSWTEYRRHFGNLVSYSLFPLYCKRALERGAALLVGRILHYTDTSDITSYTSLKSINGLFEAKNVGVWGDGITVTIQAATSGAVGKMDIIVKLAGFSELDEKVRDVSATLVAGTELNKLNFNSQLINVTAGTLVVGTYTLGSGTDDNAGIVNADYIGNVNSGTGLHVFDNNNDFVRICIPENYDGLIETTLVAYVEGRKDCLALLRTPSNISGREAIQYRQRLGAYVGNAVIDTWRAMLFFGDITVVNPYDENNIDISIIGDVIGIMSARDRQHRQWLSFSGNERGRLFNNLGIVYNLLSPARTEEADDVDFAGLNFAVQHPTFGSVLWSNSTLQKADTMLKFANVADLVVYLTRSIKPLIDSELFNPNDIITWRNIYRKVTGFMEVVKTNRGVTEYLYQGDQDVESIADAVINNPLDVDSGIFKFKLYVKPIAALKYLGVEIVVTNTSVDFEELAEQPNL